MFVAWDKDRHDDVFEAIEANEFFIFDSLEELRCYMQTHLREETQQPVVTEIGKERKIIL